MELETIKGRTIVLSRQYMVEPIKRSEETPREFELPVIFVSLTPLSKQQLNEALAACCYRTFNVSSTNWLGLDHGVRGRVLAFSTAKYTGMTTRNPKQTHSV